MGFPGASAGNADLILGREDAHEESGNPLQEIPGNPCLENPMYSLASYIVHRLARVRHDLATKQESLQMDML